MTTKLTRRALLRRTAPAIIVGAATPLWAQWLAQEMRKLNRKWFQVPQGEARTFVAFDLGMAPDKTAVALFEREADGNLMAQAYDNFMARVVQQIRQESMRRVEVALAGEAAYREAFIAGRRLGKPTMFTKHYVGHPEPGTVMFKLDS